MTKLSEIWSELGSAADISSNAMRPYITALRDADLIPRGRKGQGGCPDASPEGAAWLVLALLCGPSAATAVSLAREVAQYRNRRPVTMTYSAVDGSLDYRTPYLAADPNFPFIDALTIILRAQAGRPEPVLPRVMVAAVAGHCEASISYAARDDAHNVMGEDFPASSLDFYFCPEAAGNFSLDSGLCRLASFSPSILARVTRLLEPSLEPATTAALAA